MDGIKSLMLREIYQIVKRSRPFVSYQSSPKQGESGADLNVKQEGREGPTGHFGFGRMVGKEMSQGDDLGLIADDYFSFSPSLYMYLMEGL
jgi:hypothetical protein